MHPLFGRNSGSNSNNARTRASSLPPGGISAKLAYCLLTHSQALDCMLGMALTAHDYATDKVESLLRPVVEGEFATFTAAAGEGGQGVPPEYPYGNIKMAGRLVQAMRGADFAPVMELDMLVGKGLAVSGQGGRARCSGLVGAIGLVRSSWQSSLPFPWGI